MFPHLREISLASVNEVVQSIVQQQDVSNFEDVLLGGKFDEIFTDEAVFVVADESVHAVLIPMEGTSMTTKIIVIEPQAYVLLLSEPEVISFVEKSINLVDQVVAEQTYPLTSQVSDLTLSIIKDFPRIEPSSPKFDISDGNTKTNSQQFDIHHFYSHCSE